MKKILLFTVLFFTLTVLAQEIQFSKKFNVKAGVSYKVIDARSESISQMEKDMLLL